MSRFQFKQQPESRCYQLKGGIVGEGGQVSIQAAARKPLLHKLCQTSPVVFFRFNSSSSPKAAATAGTAGDCSRQRVSIQAAARKPLLRQSQQRSWSAASFNSSSSPKAAATSVGSLSRIAPVLVSIQAAARKPLLHPY